MTRGRGDHHHNHPRWWSFSFFLFLQKQMPFFKKLFLCLVTKIEKWFLRIRFFFFLFSYKVQREDFGERACVGSRGNRPRRWIQNSFARGDDRVALATAGDPTPGTGSGVSISRLSHQLSIFPTIDHLLNILLSFKNLQGQNDDFFFYINYT